MLREKSKLDLFEKRFSVYKAARKFLSIILRDAKIELADLFEYLGNTQDAVFLFDQGNCRLPHDVVSSFNKPRLWHVLGGAFALRREADVVWYWMGFRSTVIAGIISLMVFGCAINPSVSTSQARGGGIKRTSTAGGT